MIVVQEVINRVRFILAEQDPNNSFFSDNDIIKTISYQLLTLCRDLEITNKTITLNILKGQTKYLLPLDVEEINNVWGVDGKHKYQIQYVELDDAIKFDENITSRVLWYYYLQNEVENNELNTYICFYPVPEVNMTVYLQVLIKPPAVNSAGDKIPLPNQYLLLLSYLVLSDLLERDKRYDEATYFYGKYKDRLAIEKTKIKGKTPEYVE